MQLMIFLQETNWTKGWIEYCLYGIVVLAIIWFLINRIRRGGRKK